jgi:hypothetical protein
MRIEEVQSTTKKQRIATHTHIKGLGIAVRPPSSHAASQPAVFQPGRVGVRPLAGQRQGLDRSSLLASPRPPLHIDLDSPRPCRRMAQQLPWLRGGLGRSRCVVVPALMLNLEVSGGMDR